MRISKGNKSFDIKKTQLSIIIPTHNSAATLCVALESIKLQSFTKFEVLIIDNLSTDGTLKIAKSFQKDFINYHIISEADKGIYDAMNKGICWARGEWIYFMGSDDSFFDRKTLENIFGISVIEEVDVIYGNVYSSRFGGVYDGEFTSSKLAIKNISHQAIFFRRSVFDKIGKFNTKYRALADWDHNIRWFYSSRIKKRYLNEIIANYADGGFSSMHNDKVFNREKYRKLLIHGFTKIPRSQLRDICSLAIIQAKKNRSFLLYEVLKILKFVLKIDKFLKKS